MVKGVSAAATEEVVGDLLLEDQIAEDKGVEL